MRRIGRVFTIVLLAVASVAATVQPAAADVDGSPPYVVSLTVSSARVPASGGTVTVTMHIVDAGSGVADSPTIGFGSFYEDVLPQVALSLVEGTPQDGFWAVDYRFAPEDHLGLYYPRLPSVTDVAGNVGPGGIFVTAPVGFGKATAPLNATTSQLPGRVIRISWDPPADDGGTPITGYQVSTPDQPITVDADARFADYSAANLSAGYEITFKVVAITGAGASAPRILDPIRVALTPQSAVRDLVLTPRDRALDLAWQYPADWGGSTTNQYVAEIEPGGRVCVTQLFRCTVTGLAPHVRYTASVYSVNAAGSSAATTATARPTGELDRPFVAGADLWSRRLEVSWTLGENASVFEWFRVVVEPADGVPIVTELAGTDRHLSIEDLPEGHDYSVRLEGGGDGVSFRPLHLNSFSIDRRVPSTTAASPIAPVTTPPPSVPVPVLAPAPRPSTGVVAPTIRVGRPHVRARPSSTAVSWRAPATHGAVVTGYVVRLTHGATVTRLLARASTRSLVTRKLHPGWTYKASVIALVRKGVSKASPERSFRAH